MYLNKVHGEPPLKKMVMVTQAYNMSLIKQPIFITTDIMHVLLANHRQVSIKSLKKSYIYIYI